MICSFDPTPWSPEPEPKPPMTPYEAVMELGNPSALCVRR
jgi:hypothetical protein